MQSSHDYCRLQEVDETTKFYIKTYRKITNYLLVGSIYGGLALLAYWLF
jgi:hypothetical protein